MSRRGVPRTSKSARAIRGSLRTVLVVDRSDPHPDPGALASGKPHLVTEVGRHKCGAGGGCREDASVLVKCPTCKAVIARCGTHGDSKTMSDMRTSHC